MPKVRVVSLTKELKSRRDGSTWVGLKIQGYEHWFNLQWYREWGDFKQLYKKEIDIKMIGNPSDAFTKNDIAIIDSTAPQPFEVRPTNPLADQIPQAPAPARPGWSMERPPAPLPPTPAAPLAPELPPKPAMADNKISWEDFTLVVKAAHRLVYDLEPNVVHEHGIIDTSVARSAMVDTMVIAFARGQVELPNALPEAAPPPLTDDDVPF